MHHNQTCVWTHHCIKCPRTYQCHVIVNPGLNWKLFSVIITTNECNSSVRMESATKAYMSLKTILLR